MDIQSIINDMTLQEKAQLLNGKDGWSTKAFEKYGIKSILMTDGPNGLRKIAQDENGLPFADAFNNISATSIPNMCAVANSFDETIAQSSAEIIANECVSEGVSILLAPGINIKRSSLCGRNFEYYSEDPILSGTLGGAFISGIEKNNIASCLKHFAVNNQETDRMSIDAIVDKRALHEVYLKNFEIALKKGNPSVVMCAYNKINGQYACENQFLLKDILRGKFGFDGLVLSDWGAINDKVSSIIAGTDLEMPTNTMNEYELIKACNENKISLESINKSVERLLRLIFRNTTLTNNKYISKAVELKQNHVKARELANDCIVLLKNKDNILPLNKNDDFCVIGEFAKKPRFQGGGSSHVNPSFIDIPLTELNIAFGKNIKYSQGYNIESDFSNNQLVQESIEMCTRCNKVVFFAGLPERYESEGADRTHLNLPKNQISLLKKICNVNKNIVVVLFNGSVVEMPFLSSVKGILECYLLGQAVGYAVSQTLIGLNNPSGKLAETFPCKIEDTPDYLSFPGEFSKSSYAENIFVGYKYYEKKKIKPLFKFGYGLSYTTFKYNNFKIDQKLGENSKIHISFEITNSGSYFGKEAAMIFVKKPDNLCSQPKKELIAFKKISLNIGETKKLEFEISTCQLTCFDTNNNNFELLSGKYTFFIGSNLDNIFYSKTINIKSVTNISKIDSTVTYNILAKYSNGKQVFNKVLASLQEKSNTYFDYFKSDNQFDDYVKKNQPLRNIATGYPNISYDDLQEIIYLINKTI